MKYLLHVERINHFLFLSIYTGTFKNALTLFFRHCAGLLLKSPKLPIFLEKPVLQSLEAAQELPGSRRYHLIVNQLIQPTQLTPTLWFMVRCAGAQR